MSGLPDLFPGYDRRIIKTTRGDIFARIGGSGPPLLLLHGYPETHVCWHKIAPRLARIRSLVVADLPGYGASQCPAPDAGHRSYSKRAMAATLRLAMGELGFERFEVMGHDRGARVAYRMALDSPEAIAGAVILDILPTMEVWDRLTASSAIASYHWSFLAQPHPMPETLIGTDPAYYVAHTLATWTRARDLSAFDPGALAHYRAALLAPERIRAVCEDYRAGAAIDREIDRADRDADRRMSCPTLLLWGSDYVGKGSADPLDVWRGWASDVSGHVISSGHFLAEEAPEETLAAILPFLSRVRP
jgi:haloacetate dehalogenase